MFESSSETCTVWVYTVQEGCLPSKDAPERGLEGEEYHYLYEKEQQNYPLLLLHYSGIHEYVPGKKLTVDFYFYF